MTHLPVKVILRIPPSTYPSLLTYTIQFYLSVLSFFLCFYLFQVYKENLVETILPSIQSVMTAVLHYKKMGGEANLYINDDGLQVKLFT